MEGFAMSNGSQDRVAALERELAEERQARQALAETSLKLSSLLNLPDLLRTIMDSTTQLLRSETSSLMLLDEATNELTFEVATGDAGAGVKELRVPADQGIAGWVLQHNQPAVVDNVSGDNRFYEQIDQMSGFQTRNMLAVPLQLRDRTIGVIEVINKQGGAKFTDRDQEIAAALAAQAAVAIENSRLYKRLADAVVESRMSYKL
jgi:GAF domain-containing protein